MKGHVLRLTTLWMVLLATALSLNAQVSMVSTGSVWSYLDNGSDQGTAWRAPGFNDSTWKNGFAPFGYGDAGIVTTNDFGPDANNKYVTTYYRAIFNVANASSLTNLLLRIRRDDGPVVYLNGTEIFRNNLPAGAIAYNTYALAAIGDADEVTPVPTNPPPALLVNGANVIAVEMHQNTTNSSDLGFDLELLANFIPVPPVASITSPASGAVLATANVTLVAAASDQDGAVTKVEFYQAGSKVGEDTTAPYSFTVVGLAAGTYTFSVRATDSTGLATDSDDIVVQVTAPPPTLVSLDANWKYLVTSVAADPGWTNINFNDASWLSGPGKLGYGDGDEATTIGFGADSANKYPTTYFRHKFTVNNPSLYSSLTMTLVYDDGAVIYLNGAEVKRVNLPAAPAVIGYTTLALGAADYTPDVGPLATSALLAGENIITVEMHQGSANSSDLAMAVQIQGILPPSVIITSPTNGTSLTVPVNFTINAEATDTDGTVSRVDFFDGLFPLGSDATPPFALNVTALTEGQHTLTAVVTDNSGATATSAEVVVNVTDPNPPVLLSASATSNKVTVVFSKRVVPPSALTSGNYTISGGVQVQAAEYGTTSNRVVLTTTPMVNGASYTLTVNNVRDALNNVIAPNSQVPFTVLGFAASDVGAPVVQGSSTLMSGGFDVAGAGTDIGGTSDQFQFNYESDQRIGDFDIKVRLAGFAGADPFAKAGLMAREALTGNSRYVASIATPSVAGCFFQQRTTVGGATVNGGYAPTTYPNTWLRLRRVGNFFTGYASTDGSSWVTLDSATIAMPANVYVGMAVSSRNAAQLATGQFRDFGVNTGGTISSLVLNKEPLGPSSRKTGLVISEIMYHPRNVPGAANSLEFVEIFNSQSFFENIGNYRLSGSIEYTFAPGTVIPAGGFIVVARDPSFVQGHYGISGVLGPWVGASTNGLPGSGGRVRLRNPAGAVLLEVNYDSDPPWPVAADGAGHSLVLSRPSYGEGDVRAWSASDSIDGSPGKADPYGSDRLAPVVINEFLAHTDPPLDDYIELYNHSNQAVDLSGAFLTDESDTNKYRIPNGTSIPARGFYVVTVNTNTTGFALSSGGERIYLVNSNQTRVIDAVDFGPQENAVSTGRFPDGAAAFYRMASRTPGAANGATRNDSIVINEIMFSPISGDDDDEYIELYNRSASPVNLADWSLVDGVDYTFPPNSIIPANGYKVVARNRARMLANYPNLNVGNTVGDFDGSLANGGERIALAMPEYNVSTNNGVRVTNITYIVVNEVTYGDGGRWGFWSDGGGSSLELKDPRSDNRQPANWADSDESDKGQWTTIEVTGNIGETLGSPINDNLQIFLLGIGECLLDEVEVRNSGGANLIGSNYSFENGLTGWTPQGSHDHSTIENTGFISARSLHLRAGSRGDNGANRLRSPAFTGVSTTNVTLRARAKWVRGWPELMLRLHGGGLEVAGKMAIAPNLGTPGAVNSKSVANAGPAIYGVVHSPILPATGEAVVVTARATDPNTPFSLVLKYRVDPATSYSDVTMVDTGTAGDAIANDGIFSAIIPGQPTGGTVAFYIQGTDSLGGVNTFPQDVFPVAGLNRVYPLDAHTREAIIRWGDRQMPGSFGTYRLWLSATNTARWTTRLPKLNNTPLDGTFVYNNYRVIYNMMPQYAGSPWHRGQMTTGPAGSQRCDYDIEFPTDDRLLGATDFVWNNPGNPDGGNTSDISAQAEQTSYQIFKEIGVHYNYRRYVHIFVNGVQRSTAGNRPGNFIFEDSQQPNGDAIEEWSPDDTDGDLYKIEDWFEFPDNGDDFVTNNDADLHRRTTFINGFPAFHTAAYRFMWRLRSRGAGESANDYSSFYDMLNVVSPTANNTAPIDVAAISDLVDYEQWMRVFACQHAVGNWDAYGHDRGKNAYTYKGRNGKFHQWTWDIDFTMGIGGDSATTANLFDCTDERIRAMWVAPAIRRAYWRAYEDIVNGPLNNAFMDPILDAKAAALAANNVNYDPAGVTTIKNYVRDRRAFLLTQMGNLPNLAFAVNNPDSFTTNGNIATLSGTAAIGVKDIYVNGVLYPVTWTSETAWLIRIPLGAGNNQLVLQGYDNKGKPVGGTLRTNTVNNTGPAVPPPQGFVVINEIMFNPLVPEAEFVELFNISATSTFDLSGLEFNGLDYVFPPGSFIGPRAYIVLAKSRSAFSSAYGSTIPVFGQYDGNLQADGETITLVKRGATPAQDVVIDKVRYEPGLPWPVGPEGVNTASSVQLIDSAQDNSRPLNWNTFYVPPVYAPGTNFAGATNSGWRYVTYTGRIQGPPSSPGTNFLIFLGSPGGELFIDDMSLVVGTVAESGPNLLVNGDFEAPLTTGWTNMGNHAGSSVSTALSHSGNSSLRVVATGGGTANNFVRQFIPTPAAADLQYTVSYWYYSTVSNVVLNVRTQPGNSMNNITNVQIEVIPPFSLPPRLIVPGVATATPGSNNTATAALATIPPIWLNEVQAFNNSSISDNFGEREPWVELFNAGASPIDLSSLYLTDNYDTNLTRWQFPAGATIAPGEFKIVWVDGEPGETSGTNLHTNFRLVAGSGTVALTRVVNGNPEILDYLTYSGVPAGRSYGDFPDGQPFTRFTMRDGTPRGTNSARLVDVFINEWLAANTNTIADPADGQFEDWIELYNAGTNSVDLGGFWLTDNPGSPNDYFQVPANGQYVIPAGGFLLVWADNEPSQNSSGRPDLHVNFALGRGGDNIALYAPDKQTLIDRVTFGAQTDDISQGRYPDGANNTNNFANTTPRSPNQLAGGNTPPNIFPIGPKSAVLGQPFSFTVNAFDSQFSQALTFTILSGAPAGATIHPTSGLFTWNSAFSMVPSTNTVTIQVTDNGTPPLSDTETFTLFGVPPAPTLGINGNQINLGFGTIPGKTYRVEYKDDLGAAVWQRLNNQDYPAGAATSLTVNDLLNHPQRFYRIVQLD